MTGLLLLSISGFVFSFFITGSIARSAKRQYLSYSEADFAVFRPAGTTRCNDGGEILHGRGDRRSAPSCQISPPSVQRKGIGPKNKFLLRLDQNVEYKRDFHKICKVSTPLQDALAVKFRWIFSRGYGVMGVLS